jgi:hypothetical protein
MNAIDSEAFPMHMRKRQERQKDTINNRKMATNINRESSIYFVPFYPVAEAFLAY